MQQQQQNDGEKQKTGCWYECTKCFRSNQEFTHEDSQKKDELSQILIQKYQKNTNFDQSNLILDTLQVIIRIYASPDDRKDALQMLSRCRLNPDYSLKVRNDLAYYIPQLVNFMVFHTNMTNQQLSIFIMQACELDFFFAHQVYFQLESVSCIIQPKGVYEIKPVRDFLDNFEQQMTENYANAILIASKLFEDPLDINLDLNKQSEQKRAQQYYRAHQQGDPNKKFSEDIQEYGTKFYKENNELILKSDEIFLQNYTSAFENQKLQNVDTYIDQGFRSNIEFWSDLILISQRLSFANPKIISLKADLQKVNQLLPSAVYIPFIKDSIRNYVVLNIVADESRVFSTKVRSPFSLCIELYRPEEQEQEQQIDLKKKQREQSKISILDQSLSIPRTINMLASKKRKERRKSSTQTIDAAASMNTQTFKQDDNMDQPQQKKHRVSFSYSKNNQQQQKKDYQVLDSVPSQISEIASVCEQSGIAIFYGVQDDQKSGSSQDELIFSINQNQKIDEISLKTPPPLEVQSSQKQQSQQHQDIDLSEQEIDQLKKIIFGESSDEQSQRVKKNSPFRNLKSWRLINIIVKTDDNLKQEQFALQLISQFQQIFQKERLPLKLTYYEVLSLGPDSGIIEMVKDCTTIDSLKKNLSLYRKDLTNFSNFFRSYFKLNYEQALQNYINSLVAYCLVTYFLQVKDRHNGNILLLNDGTLMHIDFGFFLSNAPGGSLEFEGSVPFKLLSENLKVLGGLESKEFDIFRRLFFKGFQAAQKHQDEILILVKMMYSGHGTTLPCFKKGEQGIRDLESRFNPPCNSDGELSIFIQQLINSSLDNWRARWYDKFQYYVQGIFY